MLGACDAVPAAVVRPAAARRPVRLRLWACSSPSRRCCFSRVTTSWTRHRLDDPVRLSGDGRGHHGRGFREGSPTPRSVSIALATGASRCSTKGERARRSYLAGVVLVFLFGALLCGLDRRRQNRSSLQGPSDRETHLLRSGFSARCLCRSAAGLCRSATRPLPTLMCQRRCAGAFPDDRCRWSRWPGAIRRIGSTPRRSSGRWKPVTAPVFRRRGLRRAVHAAHREPAFC